MANRSCCTINGRNVTRGHSDVLCAKKSSENLILIGHNYAGSRLHCGCHALMLLWVRNCKFTADVEIINKSKRLIQSMVITENISMQIRPDCHNPALLLGSIGFHKLLISDESREQLLLAAL